MRVELWYPSCGWNGESLLYSLRGCQLGSNILMSTVGNVILGDDQIWLLNNIRGYYVKNDKSDT